MATQRNGKRLVQVTIPEIDYQRIRKIAYESEMTVNQYLREMTLQKVRRIEGKNK